MPFLGGRNNSNFAYDVPPKGALLDAPAAPKRSQRAKLLLIVGMGLVLATAVALGTVFALKRSEEVV